MNHNILIVDDEQHILRALKRLLRRDGYDIHLADNGPAALEVLVNTEVAVIICDQRMPGMTGDQVLAEARKIRPDAYCITLTGYTDLNAAQALINEGNVNHFLLKPWDDQALRRVVREGVRAYQLIQDNRRLETLTRQQKAELEAWNQQLEEQVELRTEELRIQNKNLLELQRRVEQSLRDTVAVLAGMLEAHSPSLGIHSKRVAQLARELGSQLDLSDEDLRDVEFAAYLHDIGKISKLHGSSLGQSPRAKRSRSATSRHSESGCAILSHVGGFEKVALGVRHQQEHYDGTGSPKGLKGESIPLAARIIAVANAYDKTVFSTSNPMNISREAGCQVLRDGQGKQFDPHIVRLLLEHLEQADAETGGDAEVQLSPKQLESDMVLSRDINNLDGVLLLKSGTVLTIEFIEHIQALSDIDPLLTDVFVRCVPAENTTGESEGLRRSSSNATAPFESDGQFVTTPRNPKKELPAAPDDQTATETQAAPSMVACQLEQQDSSSPAKPQPRKKILVVDDTLSVRNALCRELRRTGFEGVPAADGVEALGLAETGGFDLALTDLAMPNMSGEELIRRLQQCAPELPCVIITGQASKQQVVRLSNAPNVAGILAKPWDRDRLVATITTALAGRCTEQAEELV